MAADVQALSDIIDHQNSLVQDAADALPQDFSRCTYSLGHIRQAIYLCQTCPEQRGICSACSIACHTDHEQLELFPKRHFRCDCPTSSTAHACTLHRDTVEPENAENQYNQNFKGTFCRCGREYDANTEVETMIQCLACEDWLHESCLNLRQPPSEVQVPEESENTTVNAVPVVEDADDSRSNASSSGVPPPLISADDYESLVCRSCVLSIPILRRWAGTPGVLMVTRQSVGDTWQAIGGVSPSEEHDVDVDVGVAAVPMPGSDTATDTKRRRSASPTARQDLVEDASSTSKRPRTDEPPSNSSECIAPPLNGRAQALLDSAALAESKSELNTETNHSSLGAGDIFLTDGFRDRWCRCSDCTAQLSQHPFLLEEEETYVLPEDPDSGKSLEELGMRALSQLPRDRAIEGIHAFNSMRDGLITFLKPFAEEGKVVGDGDIEGFFQTLKEGRGGK